MIDTTDLTSYYLGYDQYCEPIEKQLTDDRDFYEDYILEKERIKMERKVIDLKTTDMTGHEILQLENYVWKNDKLIPSEMIEGE